MMPFSEPELVVAPSTTCVHPSTARCEKARHPHIAPPERERILTSGATSVRPKEPMTNRRSVRPEAGIREI